MFTPLQNPKTPKESRYNAAQIATRNPLERCFVVWKQRFRCWLDGITVTFPNARTLTVTLAVLHNISLDENDNVPDDCNDYFHVPEIAPSKESAYLRAFIEKYF